MPKLRTLLPALTLAATLHVLANAQLTPLNDPANLAGERVSPQDPADTLPLNHGAPALQQLLAKLRTRASLMLIVAHPDDEDGGLLTFESRGQGARVAMLTLTRGEGGQNLMSADFDDALGLIRTQELLAADRYFGVDQFFGTEVDFGFSKTKEESFQKWAHDRVLYDAVRAVRLYRPLVLASVFVGGPTDGHGQHQVAGEIAQEVFLAAADPNVFPEMIAEGLLPWDPLKVYARVPFSRVTPDGMFDYATGRTIPTRFHNYVTGQDTTAVPTATVLIHEGDKPADPTLSEAMGGDTYVQFARKGLALQKTQIGGNVRLPPAGAFDAGYTLMASRTPAEGQGFSPANILTEQSLFEGIDTSLPGIATLALTSPIDLRSALSSIDSNIAEAQRLFDSAKPELTAPALHDALRKLDGLLSVLEESQFGQQFTKQNLLHELRIKRVQLNNALLLAHGFTFTAALDPSSSPLLTSSTAASVTMTLKNAGGQSLLLLTKKYPATTSATREHPFKPDSSQSSQLQMSLSSGSFATGPYFSRPTIEQPFYNISDPALRNAPSTPPPLIASQMVDDQGARLLALAVVTTDNRAVPAQPAAHVPRLSAAVAPQLLIVPSSTPQFSSLNFFAGVRTNVAKVEPRLELAMPEGWKVTSPEQDFTLAHVNESHSTPVSVTVPNTVGLHDDRAQTIQVFALEPERADKIGTNLGYRSVGYPGLTLTNFYRPADLRVVPVDLHTAPNLRVAYLPGTGDTVPDFLPNLGITPTLLTLKDLTATTLNKYDAIILGVRAYAAHPELSGPGSQPLLDYAKQGGVIILQYNTARYGDAEAPFPIDVPGDSAHNVVEEAQPVTLLHPDAPLLAWPNRLTPADFDHWVAERGHGFAATWSPSYTPLLETHDVGQDPQQGGLLLARTGKGAYIYCALALYRQLPEGVPGAYRLLANLLSYAKNPQRAQ